MPTQPKTKVVFAPGILEQMESTMDPIELQELLDHIKELAENGTLADDANLVDMDDLEIDNPKLFKTLCEDRNRFEESIDDMPSYTLH